MMPKLKPAVLPLPDGVAKALMKLGFGVMETRGKKTRWVYTPKCEHAARVLIELLDTRPDGGDSLREALENCVKALEKLKTGHGTIIAKHCWQPISQAKAALAAKDGG